MMGKHISVGLVIATVIILCGWRSIPNLVADSSHYIALAEGRMTEVHKPFANRLLHPYIIRGIALVTGVSVHSAFLAVAIVAVVVLTVTVVKLATPLGWRGLVLMPVVTPPLFTLFRDYYLPDLFHAMLVALFLLAFGRRELAAVGLLAALMFARESTILLVVVSVIVGWRAAQRQTAALLAICMIVTVILLRIATTNALPNVHGMNELLYLALKVPFNAAKNVLGVTIWTNTADACAPVFTIRLPELSPFGQLNAFGLCAWSPVGPLTTVQVFVTSFGLAPTVLIVALRNRPHWLKTRMPPEFTLAMAYGIAALLIAPLVGASIARVASYSWPAFWVAVPVLLSQWSRETPDKLLLLLPCLHLAIAWVMWLPLPTDLMSQLIVLAVVAVVHVYAARVLLPLAARSARTSSPVVHGTR